MAELQTIIGRLKKRIARLQCQRDFWHKQCAHYSEVLRLHPTIERHHYDWRAREAERERVRGLEQRVKEQALLVEKLTASARSHPVPHDLDPAGEQKLPLSVLEQLAVDACNRVKAWAESDRGAPFPEEAHMLCDGVVMFAAQRRRGVQ